MNWTGKWMGYIPESATLRMFELAKARESTGKRVYHFEVGQPDFPTPRNIVEAARNALELGHTGYTSARGIYELREAISETYLSHGQVDPKTQIIVTPGAKFALFASILSSIDPLREVLILTPAWPSYLVMVRAARARPVVVPAGDDYHFDEEILKSRLTPKTQGIIINTPNNPTGGILTKEDMKSISDIAEDYNLHVFSDEIYDKLVYTPEPVTSMLDIDPNLEHTVIINGFSKSYSMTGWRLGYALSNPEVISNMVRIQQNTTTCATSFVQYAGIEALRGPQDSIKKMVSEYKRRLDVVYDIVRSIDGVRVTKPKGTFYIFPDFSELGIEDKTFAEELLRETGVCTTPGSAFGVAGQGHLRISFSVSLEELKVGLNVLKTYIEENVFAIS